MAHDSLNIWGIKMRVYFLLLSVLLLAISACAQVKPVSASNVGAGMPAIDTTTAIYELAVHEGVSYQDVVDSLKSLSEGRNFVNPADFPIGEHIKKRGIDPQ